MNGERTKLSPDGARWTSAHRVRDSVTVSEELNLDDAPGEVTYVDIVDATGATSFTTTGTECSSEAFTISVDATLVEGWNQMTWTESAPGFAVGSRWTRGRAPAVRNERASWSFRSVVHRCSCA